MKTIISSVLISLCLLCVNYAALNTNAKPAENTSAGSSNSANTQTLQNTGNAVGPMANGGAQDAQNTPDALLKDLYKVHAKDQTKILDNKNRTLLDKYFDKPLADMIWKDINMDEVGVVDFDLFYNSQEFEIKNLNVNPAKISGGKATVTVTFDNFGKKQTIIYNLVQRKLAWKISDINYGKDFTLLKAFRDDAKR